MVLDFSTADSNLGLYILTQNGNFIKENFFKS